MSASYVPVSWTRSKLVYDAVLLAGVSLFLVGYEMAAEHAGAKSVPIEHGSLVIRTFGACAFVLLTLALAIGPLARLDARFLPLLYNRRHLGVMTFAVAASHAWTTFDWYFSFGPLDPWRAMLLSDPGFGIPRAFPHVPFGAFALLLLGLLASTSHDFWLKFLGPHVWKGLHLALYAAYGSIVAHLALGPLQSAQSYALPALVFASAGGLVTLHLMAAVKDRRSLCADEGGWIRVGLPAEIPPGRARIVRPAAGEAIAVFNDGERFTAVRNRCAHQNGPLGEGRVIDGCIICPWHGYEYRLRDGCAPEPFTERIETYPLKIEGGVLFVDTWPQALGTPAVQVRAEEVAP